MDTSSNNYGDECNECLAKDEEIKRLKTALENMAFAYTNKDEDTPHDFEISALKTAIEILPDCKFLPKFKDIIGLYGDGD